jgi:RND family efflux transporter MFP subunit
MHFTNYLYRSLVASVCTLAVCFGAVAACKDTRPEEHHETTTVESTAKAEGGEDEPSPSTVVLTAAAEQTAGIVIEVLTMTSAQTVNASLIVPGTVETDPRRVAVISPRVAGRLERVTVVEGDRVAAGQIVGYVYTPQFVTAQSDYQQATRRAVALRGTPDAQGADAIAEAARRRLLRLGASSTDITRLAEGREAQELLPLVAPFAGSIIHANVLPGASVDAGMPVFHIADLSIVDVIASVPERAVGSIRVGQPATVTIAAYPNMRFSGHVERLKDMLDSTTRTVGAVVHVLNPSRALRPEMYATVALGIPNNTVATASGRVGSANAPLLVAPETAVVTDGSQSYVFVQTGTHTYVRRAVTATALAPTYGDATAGRVALSGDVRAGDKLVIRGAFTLKSELAKATFADDD